MAIVKEFPGRKIISGFKGTLDFYYYMGLCCVRRWPRRPGGRRTPAVRAQWPAFTYASREWRNLSPAIRRTYEILASGSMFTARDLFHRSYISGLYRNPIP